MGKTGAWPLEQRTRALGRHLAAAFAAVACALLALTCALACPPRAHAVETGYTNPKTDITMQVATDGSYRVVEYCTLELGAQEKTLAWEFADLADTAGLKVNGVRMAEVDGEGAVTGDWTQLESAAFLADWRSSANTGTTGASGSTGSSAASPTGANSLPADPSYSLDSPKNTLYVFTHRSNTRLVVEIDYEVSAGVIAYRDTSELYWTVISESWPVTARDVNVTITLPVPQGTDITPGETVRAWGHGPDGGTVSVDDAGTITLHDDAVEPGQYLEAHVLFPPKWLTHLSGKEALANRSLLRLDNALADEKNWLDTANIRQQTRFGAAAVLSLICAFLLAAALIIYLAVGKERTPDFTDAYLRMPPEAGLEPALAGRLWRWNHVDMRDFTATVMALAHKGVVAIDGTQDAAGQPTWSLSMVFGAPTGGLSQLETQAIALLFDGTGVNEKLTLNDIEQRATSKPQRFVEAMDAWHAELTRQCNERAFFEAAGKKWQRVLLVVAGLLATFGIVALAAAKSGLAAALALPTAAAIALVANYLPRRTPVGNNLVARYKALRNWLRDLSKLDEGVQLDQASWGAILPYAYEYGVASDAVLAPGAPQPETWRSWYAGSSQSALARTRRDAAAPAINESLTRALQLAREEKDRADEASATGGGFGKKKR